MKTKIPEKWASTKVEVFTLFFFGTRFGRGVRRVETSRCKTVFHSIRGSFYLPLIGALGVVLSASIGHMNSLVVACTVRHELPGTCVAASTKAIAHG